MFESFEIFFLKFKKFINYISCKLVYNSEEPYYQELPEDEIKSILF
jgi:hypothetical protein